MKPHLNTNPDSTHRNEGWKVEGAEMTVDELKQAQEFKDALVSGVDDAIYHMRKSLFFNGRAARRKRRAGQKWLKTMKLGG